MDDDEDLDFLDEDRPPPPGAEAYQDCYEGEACLGVLLEEITLPAPLEVLGVRVELVRLEVSSSVRDDEVLGLLRRGEQGLWVRLRDLPPQGGQVGALLEGYRWWAEERDRNDEGDAQEEEADQKRRLKLLERKRRGEISFEEYKRLMWGG